MMEERDHDTEFRQLLRTWQAPDAPASLRSRVLRQRGGWWQWLLTGSIRIPVPVALAAAAVLVVWVFTRQPAEVTGSPSGSQPTVSLADFEPVSTVDLRVVGGTR
jgi:hypothetical protein